MTAVDEVLIGTEFEVSIDRASGVHEVASKYADLFDEDRILGGWVLTPESPMGCEFRFRAPTPFGEFFEQMDRLFAFFGSVRRRGGSVRCGGGMGMHVHINVNPAIGPCVDKNLLVAAYFGDQGFQDTWWEHISHKSVRVPSYGYARRRTQREWDGCGVGGQFGKHGDIAYQNRYGTVEMRGWDTTLDWKMIEKRRKILASFIESAIAA